MITAEGSLHAVPDCVSDSTNAFQVARRSAHSPRIRRDLDFRAVPNPAEDSVDCGAECADVLPLERCYAGMSVAGGCDVGYGDGGGVASGFVGCGVEVGELGVADFVRVEVERGGVVGVEAFEEWF